MKAVILAGGRGERLRPITDTRPKPLVPVLARPVMDYCLSLLSHHGVTEAAVTTHYLADQIRHRYGESAFGMRLSYSSEEIPMGTAGGVKKLEDWLSGEELFLVMSGDALCDFDLGRAVRFHREKNAHATIILSSVKTPLEYGVVLSDTFEKIFAFSEKPDWSETFSDLVNTGVYILSPEILKKIPTGKVFDFSHDLFPLLLQEGYRLFGYKDEGYWCDIGKIPTLYRCNLDVLGGKARTYLPAEGKTVPSSDGKGICFISNGAKVESGAEIGSGSIISADAKIASGSRVEGTLVMERAEIKKNATVRDAVLCENSSVQEGALILPGSVLGAGSVVSRGACTQKGKKYPPLSAIAGRSSFGEEGLIFTEKGASFHKDAGVSEEEASQLGFAFSRGFQSDVGILWDEKQKESARFAMTFAAGVVRGGTKAVLMGSGNGAVASFAAGDFCIPTVFVSAEKNKGLFFAYDKDSLPLSRRCALRLARFSEDGNENVSDGDVCFAPDASDRYLRALGIALGSGAKTAIGLGGTEAAKLKKAAIKMDFAAYDGKRDEGICLEIYPESIKLFCDGKKLCDTEKAKLFLAERYLAEGKRSFYLPDTAPRLLEEHVRNRGGTVKIFSLHQTTREETEARKNGSREKWLLDLNFLAAALLREYASLGKERFLKELSAAPDVFVTKLSFYPDEENKARLLSVCAKDAEQKNTRLETGFYGMKIISEALRMEAALDHAIKYKGKLYEIEEKFKGRE